MYNGQNLLQVAATEADTFGLRCARFLFTEDELANNYLWEPGTPLRNSPRQALHDPARFNLLKGFIFLIFEFLVIFYFICFVEAIRTRFTIDNNRFNRVWKAVKMKINNKGRNIRRERRLKAVRANL